MRTLQAANTEYFQKCALLGEKSAQVDALKKETEELSSRVRELFSEIQIHKAAEQHSRSEAAQPQPRSEAAEQQTQQPAAVSAGSPPVTIEERKI